ncbi:hypothetical protein HDA40_006886 [Hamadaea flava]|nr:tachylectin-related carbohydrate-binding protein [Hamadaea flava]MCP2328379.1 hypothetical protein [Hamadaea flava]
MGHTRLRRWAVASATVVVALGGGILISPPPASAAASRSGIVSIAKREKNDDSRNKEIGVNCTYYGGEMFGWPACGGRSGWGGGGSAYAWCAAFAKYVWREAGVTTGLGAINGYAQSFKAYGDDNGTYHARSTGYKPQAGDAVVFDWDHNSSDTNAIDHVAIVTSSDDTDVYYIGGNQSDGITAVHKKRSDVDIVGYIEPVGVTGGATPPERRLGHSVTGDSYADLVGRKSDGTLLMYSNNIERDNGDPYSGTGSKIGTGWGGFNQIIGADVTGDGYTDLVGRKSDGTLWLYSNNIERDNGDPYSGTGSKIGTGWGEFNQIIGADVTGDGYTDLVGRKPDGTLWLYSNNIERDNGDPYSGTGSKIGTGWGGFNQIIGADVTGDGYTDLVGRKPDGTLWLYSNNIERDNGDPYSGTGSKIGTGWGEFNQIIGADVTGDGYTDLVGRKPDGTLWLYSNNIERDNGDPYSGTGSKIGTGWGGFNLIV